MSRLERLVILLETGSTSFIRNTAADQLADLAKSHPEDRLNLLARVYPFLKSSKWETRIAAARAFGGIVDTADVWDPNSIKEENGNSIKTENKVEVEVEEEEEKINIKKEPDGKAIIKKEYEEGNALNSVNHVLNNHQTEIKVENDSNIKVKIEQDAELEKLDNSFSSLLNFDQFSLHELIKSGTKLLASKCDESLNNDDICDDTLLGRIKRHRSNMFPPEEKDEENLASNTPTPSSAPAPAPALAINNDNNSHVQVKQEPTRPHLDSFDSQSGTVTPIQSPITETPPNTTNANTATTASTASTASTKPVSSARLKAMQRRKAKVNAKSGALRKNIDLTQSSISRNMIESGDTMDIDSNIPQDEQDTQDAQFDITSQQGGSKLVVESKTTELSPILTLHDKVSGLIWPFQGVYELLLADLFDDNWEIRHGAALGLRELVRKQGKGAGRVMNKSRLENDFNNRATLEDLAVRLCILFCLDRFGDYVSDTVVAPVRESSAQTLAALLIHVDDETVCKTFNCLYEMTLQEDLFPKCWEAKHGGILGVRYLVSVRTDILLRIPQIFDKVIQMVLRGFQESDDDVQSVSALTLMPIASQFVETRREFIKDLLSVIWDCLVNLRDDLSASIGSVMDLLAKLCSHQVVIQIIQEDAAHDKTKLFDQLVPRLYPFLRHSITNVRKAVLRTIMEFLKINNSETKSWIDAKAFRLLYQNILVEQNSDVLELSVKVFDRLLAEVRNNSTIAMNQVFVKQSVDLLTLSMTPIGIARHNYKMNTHLIMRASGQMFGTFEESDRPRGAKRTKSQADTAVPDIPTDDLNVNIDAPVFRGDVTLVGFEKIIKMRICAATAFGKALSLVNLEDNGDNLLKIVEAIQAYFNSPHATTKLIGAFIVDAYASSFGEQLQDEENEQKQKQKQKQNCKLLPATIAEHFSKPLTRVLEDPSSLQSFKELVPTLKAVRTSCLQLFDCFVSVGRLSPSKIPQIPVVVQGEAEAGAGAFSLDIADKIRTETFEKLKKGLSASSRLSANQALEDAKHRVTVAIEESRLLITNKQNAILAAYAGAQLKLAGLPKKLNPIIKSLMESIKTEESYTLQSKSVGSLAYLVLQLIANNKQNVADKILKNLCAFVCVDTAEVPEFHHNVGYKDKILSLRKEEALTDPADVAAHERATYAARIKRQGALMTLEAILKIYASELFVKIPKIKDLMIGPLRSLPSFTEADLKEEFKGQSIIDALGILRALLPKLDRALIPEISENLDLFLSGLKSEYSVFRYASAKCFATICLMVPTKAFTFLVNHILPMLKNAGNVTERQGAVETIYHISATMGTDILPYVMFLIVPILGRMSDSDHDVRVLATTTFASIIKLVPLEAGIPDPEDMPKELLEGRERERDFILQMMDPTKIKPFDLPVAIKATLRKYQQEGVNWLAFLNKYHLHGILCDDMGLGKTLQTICMMSSDHHMRAEKYKETQSPEYRKLPSLVICPPSLTGHWEQEINQYAPFMSVLVYAGNPSIRTPLRSKLTTVDVVVTSYDVARNDVEFVSSIDYNYCVLDEGHIIKNANSKLAKSVKRVKAEHRLILSGTPIQNNVLELWSLFDFLMPGFLGSEKVFHDKFAKPIAASRNSKTSSKEQEAGALALESLHKQVLPFMLRRLKEDVLADLPPKIIQDYYCELSDLQRKLYKEFAKSQKETIKNEVSTSDNSVEGQGQAQGQVQGKGQGQTHVFQALQYMRKLCNHPALVVSPNHPKFNEVSQFLAQRKSQIRDIEHSPKLMSLKTILLECGIGSQDADYGKSGKSKKSIANQNSILPTQGVISEHRALIFCQLKDMLDIVENDLLKKYLPSVTYMRLDGSTDPRHRQSIVRKFNEDPSIDVLLLTTKVGGLGLNLTGADTVIFVEHDWNPMNDLQAMDRAHRLGQKKVVNVYRLITKDTLEEKIMGLQKFKMNIASTIVNQQNAGLQSMDTNQLLDLFDVEDTGVKVEDSRGNGGSGGGGDDEASRANGNSAKEIPDLAGGLTGKAAGAVGELGELWDEQQYEEEYDLDNFIKTLK